MADSGPSISVSIANADVTTGSELARSLSFAVNLSV